MFPLVSMMMMFGVMYTLVLRPQRRRLEQHRQLISTLAVGDEVVTVGGLYGLVIGLDGDLVSVEVAPGIPVRISPAAISGRTRYVSS
jgi:preprotein translocase subunit YajC